MGATCSTGGHYGAAALKHGFALIRASHSGSASSGLLAEIRSA